MKQKVDKYDLTCDNCKHQFVGVKTHEIPCRDPFSSTVFHVNEYYSLEENEVRSALPNRLSFDCPRCFEIVDVEN